MAKDEVGRGMDELKGEGGWVFEIENSGLIKAWVKVVLQVIHFI